MVTEKMQIDVDEMSGLQRGSKKTQKMKETTRKL